MFMLYIYTKRENNGKKIPYKNDTYVVFLFVISYHNRCDDEQIKLKEKN